MAIEININLLKTMQPGTVIALIDHMPTVVTAMQADIHGLPIVYAFEEAQALLNEIVRWGTLPTRPDIDKALMTITRRIDEIDHPRHRTLWNSKKEWEQKCLEWEIQHRTVLETLHTGSDATKFV